MSDPSYVRRVEADLALYRQAMNTLSLSQQQVNHHVAKMMAMVQSSLDYRQGLMGVVPDVARILEVLVMPTGTHGHPADSLLQQVPTPEAVLAEFDGRTLRHLLLARRVSQMTVEAAVGTLGTHARCDVTYLRTLEGLAADVAQVAGTMHDEALQEDLQALRQAGRGNASNAAGQCEAQ